MAGRLTLIKSVILGAFTHSFFMYKWPNSILKDLNSCIRNFLWSGSTQERKLITVAWNDVYKSISNGGLGLKELSLANKTFLKKSAWDFFSNCNWISSFLKKHFLKYGWLPKKFISTSSSISCTSRISQQLNYLGKFRTTGIINGCFHRNLLLPFLTYLVKFLNLSLAHQILIS